MKSLRKIIFLGWFFLAYIVAFKLIISWFEIDLDNASRGLEVALGAGGFFALIVGMPVCYKIFNIYMDTLIKKKSSEATN